MPLLPPMPPIAAFFYIAADFRYAPPLRFRRADAIASKALLN